MVDNVLAGIWLIPWMTILTKWDKLYTFFKQMWPEDKTFFMELLDKVWEKLGIAWEYLNKLKDKLFWVKSNKVDNFRNFDWIDYSYTSPINKIDELLKLWDLEKVEELLLTNSRKLYFPENSYSEFNKYITQWNYKEAFEIYKQSEAKSIEKLKNIWFSIEDNLKFYEALKNWNIDEIKRLLDKSKKISWDVYKWDYKNTSDLYWISRDKITDVEKYNKKGKMINPISWKEELLSRNELHELIISKFLDWIEKKDTPVFLVLWWMSWSWKSEIKKWLNNEIWNHIEVDPDAVRRLLPEFKENMPETSITTHQESLFISKQILNRAIENNGNILRETIMTRKEPLLNYIEKWWETHKMDFRFVFSWEESWLRNTLWRDRTVNPQVYVSQFKAFETVVDMMWDSNIKNLKIILNLKEEEIIFNKINWLAKPTSWEWMKKFFIFNEISKKINN